MLIYKLLDINLFSYEHAVHFIFSILSGASKNKNPSIYSLYLEIIPILPIFDKVVVLYF